MNILYNIKDLSCRYSFLSLILMPHTNIIYQIYFWQHWHILPWRVIWEANDFITLWMFMMANDLGWTQLCLALFLTNHWADHNLAALHVGLLVLKYLSELFAWEGIIHRDHKYLILHWALDQVDEMLVVNDAEYLWAGIMDHVSTPILLHVLMLLILYAKVSGAKHLPCLAITSKA